MIKAYLGEQEARPPSIHCRGTVCYPRTSYYLREQGYPGEYLGELPPLPWSIDCRGTTCYTKNAKI